MSYTPKTYTKGSKTPHTLSRSKVDLFLECPRCFYLLERLGVKRPSMASFTLNLAVDELLKREFDAHRKSKTPHPLCIKAGLSELIPYSHDNLEEWRANFTGIRYNHKDTNITFFGAVDDLWVDTEGALYVVDYKATAKNEAPTLDGRWGEQYKRQVEFYAWLLRGNGFVVSDRAYFVYVNGKKDEPSFNEKLLFDVELIPHTGTDTWIEPLLVRIKETLESDAIPKSGTLCEYCPYREGAGNAFKAHVTKHKQ